MTLPHEQVLAVQNGYRLMMDLMDSQATPRVPRAIRLRARQVLKHYPIMLDEVTNTLKSIGDGSSEAQR